MRSPPPDRLVALVREALRRPPETRSDFLRAACAGDARLFEEASGILERTAPDQSSANEPHQDPPTTTGYAGTAGAQSFTGLPATGQGFVGTERFVLQRQLGAGGFGVVYEARDQLTDSVVALKLLKNVTSESLYRFKREFRSLADVSHRNLVQLYELAEHEGHWFFTMERVRGRNFLQHLRERATDPQSRSAETGHLSAPVPILLRTLRQLVEGLAALHRFGHLHRDVKPSNVLVAHDGRVVILDFGLVQELARDTAVESLLIAGTPTYMSPEQAAGLPLTPASDWYSVGVMLYEALTGAAPFRGTAWQVITDKQQIDPPPPSAVVSGVPSHLDLLCVDLLARDPLHRPRDHEILERLWAGEPGTPATRPDPAVPGRTDVFIGREQYLGLLHDALQTMMTGSPAIATVTGPSGIGKSALVKAFLKDVRARAPDTVILAGRCYERESVPYKALDSLVDSLSRWLRARPAHEIEALLPLEMAALAQLFPVLRDLQQRQPHRLIAPTDAQESRRRASGALRELLARIANRYPLVLVVDDLQWGDVDSATLLTDVFQPPTAPVSLLIAVYRDIEIETSPFLRLFLASAAAVGRSSTIRLDPLTAGESQALVATLLASRMDPDSGDMVALIASESAGSPFFIDELVRFALVGGTPGRAEASVPATASDTDAREATLAHMIGIRVARLPGHAQQLLHAVVVNGRPMPERVLQAVVSTGDSAAALAALRSEHLVRARETGEGVEWEPYHDRIRELVSATLPWAELRDCHRRLAGAWEQQSAADAELLADHWLAAGDVPRAAHHSRRAAEQADRALAFERAARLYRRSLELVPDDPDRVALLAGLAQALANAGRCSEAATVYLSAAASGGREGIVFRQKAAQQLLFAGHIDEGFRVVREVLHGIGMRFPETRLGTLAALGIGRLRVRMRGMRYRERAASAVSTDDLMKVDACWSVSAGLSIVDTVRGAVFQSRHFLLAVKTGERERLHRALCLEAGFAAARGSRAGPRVGRLIERSAELARRVQTPYAAAMQSLVEGVVRYLAGRWSAAEPLLAEAERLFSGACTGVTWELDSARFFRLWALYQLGHVKTVSTRIPVLANDAVERGDLYASTTIHGLFAHFACLAADDPEGAVRHGEQAASQWTQKGFQMPQLWLLWSQVDVALYTGRGMEAWSAVRSSWPALRRSLLLETQWARITMLDVRGRAAVAAASESSDTRSRDGHLREALRCASLLERERAGWAEALALVLRACVARVQRRAGVAEAFGHAREVLSRVEMRLLVEVARRFEGESVGEARGQALRDESSLWMDGQEIRDPERFSRVFAP